MSYVTVKNEQGDFDLLEKETDSIIEIKQPENVVRELCRKANLGGGFDGFTPSFFLESSRNYVYEW